jgi:hypothetical protein
MKQKLLAGVFVVGSAVLAACGGGYYSSGYYVRSAPPAPRYYGPVGVGRPGYVWTNGYWDYRGNNWRWADGRWVRPPRRGAQWVAPEWRQDGRGYRLRRGYWR